MPRWNARQVQLVWFVTKPPPFEAASMFNEIARKRPTATQSGEFPVPVGTGSFEHASGPDSDGNSLALQISPGRVDVVLSPMAGPQGPDARPVLFSDITPVKNRMQEISEVVSRAEKTTTRCACVISLVIEQESQLAANRFILEEIGIADTDLEDFADVSFNINTKKIHEWGHINRVLRWQIEAFQNVSIQIGFNQGFSPASIPIYLAALNVDINTIQSDTPIKNEKDVMLNLISEASNLWNAGTLAAIRKVSV